MKIISTHLKAILTLLFGVVVFLFWRCGYSCAFGYHEQLQLFLFDGGYFQSRFVEPGGLTRYAAEFLVQFYQQVTAGALIIALCLMSVQGLTWRLANRDGEISDTWYPLSFLPSLILWYLMGDENTMMSFVVSFMMALLAMSFFPKERKYQWIYLAVAVPCLYWMAGPVVLMLAFYAAYFLCREAESKVYGSFWGAVAVLYGLLCLLLSSYCVPFTIGRLFRGIDYYRFPEITSYVMVVLMAVGVLIPLFMRKLPTLKHRPLRWELGLGVMVTLLSFLLVPKGFDAKTYELMEYEYLVRNQDWQGIIDKAQKQQPSLPMSVCATNLALGMTNQLGDRIFQFYQHGTLGLIPKFEKNFISSLLTGEVYYHLGLINTAQRFDFEAMEGIPNYNKSARVMKRLAETNLINGQYAVAEKYLDVLSKTMFYSQWAERTRALIKNPKSIAQYPEYAEKRKMRLTQDFLFSEDEIDKILGRLFIKNKDNALAMQYLMVYPLLEKDLNKFMAYGPIIQQAKSYDPEACQEAIAFVAMQRHQQPPQGLVDDMVMQNLSNFAQTYTQSGKGSPMLDQYKGTFWYYFMSEN